MSMRDKLSTKKLSRRQFLVRAGQGFAATTILAACAPQGGTGAAPAASSDGAAPADEPVTLEFHAWADPADLTAWDTLAEMHMERNPNVTINVNPPPDSNANFYAKLQTLVAGGSPPHVSSFQGWEWQPFADNGVLAAIDEFVEQDNFMHPYPEGIASVEVSTRRAGKRYLIPLQMGTMVMFYVKQIFDEAGVPYPTEEWTFDEFLDTAEKLTKTDGDQRTFGLQANGSWARDIHWIRNTGTQELDELVDPTTAQFNQPEIVDVLQKMAYDVYHTLKVSPTAADMEGGINVLQNGNVGMKYEGPWFFGRLNNPELREQGKEIEFDVALMPKLNDEGRPHRGWSEGVAIPQTEHVAEAWGFVSFMGGEEGNKIYAEITGRIPNNIDLVESFWIPTVQERFGVENGQAFVESFKRSEVDVIGGVPRSKIWNEAVKPFGYDPMLGGSATAAEVLPKVDEELQKILDDFWATQG